jgi:hypothetical protein
MQFRNHYLHIVSLFVSIEFFHLVPQIKNILIIKGIFRCFKNKEIWMYIFGRGDSMEIINLIALVVFLGTLLSIEGKLRKIIDSNKEIVDLLKEIKTNK